MTKKYVNKIGYSDIYPFEIIRRTKKTIVIREMRAELDPNYKPIFVQGGFAGHCINQDEQKWIITPNKKAPEYRAYRRKDGNYYVNGSKFVEVDNPVKFYDYNF